MTDHQKHQSSARPAPFDDTRATALPPHQYVYLAQRIQGSVGSEAGLGLLDVKRS
jgi:hypothetical protein